MEEKVNERITIRLPEETLSSVDDFMRAHGISNRSELVRSALEFYMEKHRHLLTPSRFSEICVELPKRAALAMEYLDTEGYVKVSALDGVLQEAASEWVIDKTRKYVGKSLDELLEDMARSEKNKEEVMDIVRK